MDFRDHHIKKALDETVGPYRPDKSPKSRFRRIAITAALALVALLGFWSILHYSTPRPAPAGAERKPIAVELLPPGKP